MFYLSYLFSELRRRGGRTIITALGLAIGVALVIAVSALSQGLDEAQKEVLAPLTGLGTDLTIARPLRSTDDDEGFSPGIGGLLQLSPDEIERLQKENESAIVDPSALGDPGDPFEADFFVTTTQLSFPESELEAIRDIEGIAAAAPALTLALVGVAGKVPEAGFQGGGIGPGGQPGQDINFDPSTVSGVDRTTPDLGLINPTQISDGEWFSDADTGAGEAVVNLGYAGRKGLKVGSPVTVDERNFTIVGIAEPPLGGSASDIYIDLRVLQELSDREGRINVIQARAEEADVVSGVAAQIEETFAGSTVTTAAELSGQISGSLLDANRLVDRLSLVLAAVALGAAFLIATLLTLTGVNKRVRELGTLTALGWSRATVIRQVAGEALMTGVVGAIIGAGLGALGAWGLAQTNTQLTASVDREQAATGPLGFGQGQVVSGSSEVSLGAPLSIEILLAAAGLALLGGLIAGLIGGWRAARLRPVDALRNFG